MLLRQELPASLAPPERRPRRRSPRPPDAHPGNADHPLKGVPILIVEDDPASAKLLVVVLSQAGAKTRVASSAEEALAMLKVYRARMVIVDLVLPRMGGLLLVVQLKADPRTRDAIAVAVSAINGHGTERLARESGCAAYVRKPIDIDEFPLMLSKLIGGGA